MPPRDVVNTANAKAFAKECKFCLKILAHSDSERGASSGHCGESGMQSYIVNFPFRCGCVQVCDVVNDFHFLWVRSAPTFALASSNSRKQDDTKIGWQRMSPACPPGLHFLAKYDFVSTTEFQLKIGNSLHLIHGGCVFCLRALRFRWVVNTNPRKVSRRLLGGNTPTCFLLPPSPRLRSPKRRRHLLALHHDPWALAPTRLAQRGTSFDVSTPPPQCAWEENGTPLHALQSTQSYQSNFPRRH